MNVDWEGLLPIKETVIVVEDDPTLRSLMKGVLTEVGVQTLAFDTADDALIALQQSHESCSLVIVDQGLPGRIQGTEFIKMVHSRWPSIAAVLTSGYSINPLDVPICAIYLQKPWSLDELMTSVADALQLGKLLSNR
ncbi:response regulator [Pseudomonas sp. AF76]|uniref:response regulator n=1 Tax=Pseudomonas sp. AF76 TaxID=554393 RepID=UPI000F470B94|nr:response regulator [Pseudomonas sp. AF76]ROO34341.1 response regulator [Pseudomonas sp. AF76]